MAAAFVSGCGASQIAPFVAPGSGQPLLALRESVSTETVLHSFNEYPNDGAVPAAGVTDVGGALYGTTLGGGTYGHGTVFSFSP